MFNNNLTSASAAPEHYQRGDSYHNDRSGYQPSQTYKLESNFAKKHYNKFSPIMGYDEGADRKTSYEPSRSFGHRSTFESAPAEEPTRKERRNGGSPLQRMLRGAGSTASSGFVPGGMRREGTIVGSSQERHYEAG